MPSVPQPPSRDVRREGSRHHNMTLATVLIAAGTLLTLIAGFMAIEGSLGRQTRVAAAEVPDPAATSTTSSTTTTTTATTTTTTLPPTTTTIVAATHPGTEARYFVADTESEPEAKRLAADIAYALTTYEASSDHGLRLAALRSLTGVDALAAASESLIYPDSWSIGQVIYPQLGGLRNGRASVMVVIRQTVGSGGEVGFSVVRTLDIRLVFGESGWEFDHLSSAGGTFDGLEDFALAHSVATDPRIEMPDSARLDILAGRVSPVLLALMAQIADRTPYSVTVLATGHPHNVFETERLSDHTVGRAIDIVRVGDRRVIDDRNEDSATRALVEWLLARADVRQVGSPWDLDGTVETRSFTDAVHQDHIHLAVEVAP